ncbi:hypothetical protein M9Y10_014647, partial [Tritrichomonas musculus]
NVVNVIIEAVNGINSCHCMNEGGLHDQVVKVEGLVNNLDGYITSTILPEVKNLWQSFSNFSNRVLGSNADQIMAPLNKIETVYSEGKSALTTELTKIWAPPNDETEKSYDIVDPSQKIKDLSIPI